MRRAGSGISSCCRNRRSQGATEYLVILGAVLLVSLVVVSVSASFPSSQSSVRQQQSKSYWSSATPLSITSFNVGLFGASFTIANRLSIPVRLRSIVLVDSSGTSTTAYSSSGEKIGAGSLTTVSNTSFSSVLCVRNSAGFSYKQVVFTYDDYSISNQIQTGNELSGPCGAVACASGGGLNCNAYADGTYIVNIFSGVGSTLWAVPAGVTQVEYLVVAGGGGGASGGDGGGSAGTGAGGAGGFRAGTGLAVSGSINVTVGSGGTGGALNAVENGGDGGNSSFSTIVSMGGGGGGASLRNGVGIAGRFGGSGGGGGWNGASGSPALSSPSQGYAGGNSVGLSGGGGGGASSAGSGSTGGNSITSSITGSPVSYARGGAGGYFGCGSGSAGAASTGNGGGGTYGANGVGGTGGSGVVIIRYLRP